MASLDRLKLHLTTLGIDATHLTALCDSGADTVYYLAIPGGKLAIQHWQQLYAKAAETGYYPVLLGVQDDLDALSYFTDMLVSNRDNNPTLPQSHILHSETIDPKAWFAARQEMLTGNEDDEWSPYAGAWPDETPATRTTILAAYDLIAGKPRPEIFIGFAPTSDGFNVPAYLNFGEWNDCPSAAEHVSLLHYWCDQYKAAVVAITRDTIELIVGQPPTERASAIVLAEEMFLYCEDAVTQGTESIENLAAGLISGKTWHFWWD